MNFPSRNYVLNKFPRITNWKINLPMLLYSGVHIYILQSLSFLLLHNLLDLILRAKLVKEVPGESWDVFQLANCLDPVMQVSILLKNKGRLWTHCRKFLRKECYYPMPAIEGCSPFETSIFHLSLIQQSLHSYRQHGSVGSIEEGEDVVVVRLLATGQHLIHRVELAGIFSKVKPTFQFSFTMSGCLNWDPDVCSFSPDFPILDGDP